MFRFSNRVKLNPEWQRNRCGCNDENGGFHSIRVKSKANMYWKELENRNVLLKCLGDLTHVLNRSAYGERSSSSIQSARQAKIRQAEVTWIETKHSNFWTISAVIFDFSIQLSDWSTMSSWSEHFAIVFCCCNYFLFALCLSGSF